MVAKYTVKIGDRFYKAGETLPDTTEESKAVSTPKEVEPPEFMNPPVEPVAEEQPTEQPQKRRYTRRK